jgi:hypothetical protein
VSEVVYGVVTGGGGDKVLEESEEFVVHLLEFDFYLIE